MGVDCAAAAASDRWRALMPGPPSAGAPWRRPAARMRCACRRRRPRGAAALARGDRRRAAATAAAAPGAAGARGSGGGEGRCAGGPTFALSLGRRARRPFNSSAAAATTAAARAGVWAREEGRAAPTPARSRSRTRPRHTQRRPALGPPGPAAVAPEAAAARGAAAAAAAATGFPALAPATTPRLRRHPEPGSHGAAPWRRSAFLALLTLCRRALSWTRSPLPG